MFKNHLLIAFRQLRRQRLYFVISVAGLGVSIAACLLIWLFVHDELSYDRFHENADRIFRVVRREQLPTSAALAPTMADEIPAVEKAVRLSRRWPEVLVTHEGGSAYEQGFFFTDSTFFDVFSFPLLAGDPKTVLSRPFSVVITETIAERYFGNEDPLGRQINLKGPWDAYNFEITGVAYDPPHNSHFKFSFLGSFDTRYRTDPSPEDIGHWFQVGELTYVLLKSPGDSAAVSATLPDFFVRHEGVHFADREMPDPSTIYSLQPITDIHLYSHLGEELEPNAEVRYLYIFSIVAFVILLIACINYTNLATAQSTRRAKEIGVRKVAGASRSQLVMQFLMESAMTSAAALVIGVLLVVAGLSWFNGLTGKQLSLGILAGSEFWVPAMSVGIVISLFAGVYPAFFLSRFKPARVLKGSVVRTGKPNRFFRSTLVVIQFAASVILIVGTLVVQSQLGYLKEKRLGLNPDQVLVLPTRDAISRSYEAFKNEILKHPRIVQVSRSTSELPGRLDQMLTLYPELPKPGEEPEEAFAIAVGADFLSMMEIPLIAGRAFLPEDFEHGQSEIMPVLINRTAARQFGWEDPLGQEFACCFQPTARVVGLVEDFHYHSLKERIAPIALLPTWWTRLVLVKAQPEQLPETIEFIRSTWAEFAPGIPFEYTFMDDRFHQIYDAEERLANVFGIFSFLAIVIACCGLFGLAAYTSEQRTKEIGIRKVMGATVNQIIVLLSRDFLRLVLISIILAAPLAYLLVMRWLEDFPYRTEIRPSFFIAASGAAIIISMVTVSSRAIRAALTRPADTLRYE